MIVVIDEEEEQVIKKLDEILTRVKTLEEIEKKGSTNSMEIEDTSAWSKVIDRRKKTKDTHEGRDKDNDNRRDKDKEEETNAKKKRNTATTLQAMKRRLPNGAGVLLELQGGT